MFFIKAWLGITGNGDLVSPEIHSSFLAQERLFCYIHSFAYRFHFSINI